MIVNGRSYFSNLDGLRFFAFLHVFITHAFVDPAAEGNSVISTIKEYLAPGFFGIDLFFVLSGFLITWTLLEERFHKRTINLKNYFARRSLRIWPLYFLIVTIGFTLYYIANNSGLIIQEIPGFHWFALFILNFYISINGPHFLFFLVFLWSIAVEEQFYVLWGIVSKYFRRAFPHACIILILVSSYFRYRNIDYDNKLVFHSLSVAGNFATGALFAWNCFYKGEFYRTLMILRRSSWIRVYVLFFVLYALYARLFNASLVIVFEKLIFSFLFCLILFDQCFSVNRLFNAGGNKIINYLGKISYGLYCYHGIVLTLIFYLSKQYEMDSAIFIFVLNPIIAGILISSLRARKDWWAPSLSENRPTE